MSSDDWITNAGCETALLKIIDDAYAAALAETTWDKMVAGVQRAGNFDGVAIVSLDRSRRAAGNMLASAGLGRCRTSGRPLGAQPLNPLLTDAVLRSKPGAVWFDHEIMASPLWADTAFRAQWMGAQGLNGWACVVIASGAEAFIYLEIFVGPARSPLGHQTLTLLTNLAPHLIRSWRIANGTLSHPSGAVTRATGQEGSPCALPPDAQLRAVFGLTRAEARLALHLASGRSLACAADAFDVRMSTLRSQLGQVYSKTGTGRQCELVSLILRRASFAEPAKHSATYLTA